MIQISLLPLCKKVKDCETTNGHIGRIARTLMKTRAGTSIVSREWLLPLELIGFSRRGSNPLHINTSSALVIRGRYPAACCFLSCRSFW